MPDGFRFPHLSSTVYKEWFPVGISLPIIKEFVNFSS